MKDCLVLFINFENGITYRIYKLLQRCRSFLYSSSRYKKVIIIGNTLSFLFFFPLYFATIKCNRTVASKVCNVFFTCCSAKRKELIHLNCPLCLLDYDCRLGCGSSCTQLQHQLFNHTTAFMYLFIC